MKNFGFSIFCLLFILLVFSVSVPSFVSVFAQDTVIDTSKQGKPADKDKQSSEFTKQELSPDNPLSPIYLGKTGIRRSTGDPTSYGYASEAARLGSGHHPPALSMQQYPTDKFNLINWVALVNIGAISPSPTIDSTFHDTPPLDLNILFDMQGGFVDNVIFPHDVHTYWLNCNNCHDSIFIPRAGSNEVKMPQIVRGEWCGRCHGKVAFPVSDCTRCHRFPPGHMIEKTAVKRIRKFLKSIDN